MKKEIKEEEKHFEIISANGFECKRWKELRDLGDEEGSRIRCGGSFSGEMTWNGLPISITAWGSDFVQVQASAIDEKKSEVANYNYDSRTGCKSFLKTNLKKYEKYVGDFFETNRVSEDLQDLIETEIVIFTRSGAMVVDTKLDEFEKYCPKVWKR